MKALDLFAGTGWGVACKKLGIFELGADNDQSVILTRKANGMNTPFYDAWKSVEDSAPKHELQIASPPCQPFTTTGTGQGVEALNEARATLKALTELPNSALRLEYLRRMEQTGDPRAALVFIPLLLALETRPEYIAWEQVPPILPIWEGCATVLRQHGYNVKTGILSAEEFGVPQTRQRAFLVASRDHRAYLPIGKYSRYNVRNPYLLEEGKYPWMSMDDALNRDGPVRQLRSNYSKGGTKARGYRASDTPCSTITSKALRMKWHEEGREPYAMTIAEAMAFQTYPKDFKFVGNRTEVMTQIGNAVPPLLAQVVLTTLLYA